MVMIDLDIHYDLLEKIKRGANVDEIMEGEMEGMFIWGGKKPDFTATKELKVLTTTKMSLR